MKKTLLLTLVLFFSSELRASTPALIAHTAANGSGNSLTTSGIDSTGGNFAVILCGYQDGASLTGSDSKTNTWQQVNLNIGVRSLVGTPCIIWSYLTSTGSSHTFTLAGTGMAASFEVLVFSNVAGMTAVKGAAALQPGAVLSPTTGKPDLVLSVIACNSAPTTATFAIDSSFTITDQKPFVGGSNYGSAAAYLIQSSPASVNPTWSGTGGGSCGAINVIFDSATAAGGGTSGYIAKILEQPRQPVLIRRKETPCPCIANFV